MKKILFFSFIVLVAFAGFQVVSASYGGSGGSYYRPTTVPIIPVVTTPTVTPTAPSLAVAEIFKISRVLKLAKTGNDVNALQLFLISQNKGPAALALATNGATHYFGKLTKAALVEWQIAVGLVGDGVFGPLSKAAALR